MRCDCCSWLAHCSIVLTAHINPSGGTASHNNSALQDAATALTTAREDLSSKQSALATFDAKHLRPTDAGEVPELSPVMQNARKRLVDDCDAATAAQDATEQQSQAAEAALKAAQDMLWQPCTKVQLYWLKGIAPTQAAVVEAITAGIPIWAMLHVHDAGKASATDAAAAGTGHQLFTELQEAQHHMPWDAAELRIALLDVAVGPQGRTFVPPGHYDPHGGASAPVLGAAEMQKALRAVSACAAPYQQWLQERSVTQLAESTHEQGVYQRLIAQVPAEKQSVPVMMHCMLEQALCNTEDAGAATEKEHVMAEAATAFDRAMALVLGTAPAAGTVSADECTGLVMHGDAAAMAQHGLLSGSVHMNSTGVKLKSGLLLL